MRQPVAKWNQNRDCWEEPQEDIFGHSGVWSETWPPSGMTQDGWVFELPMSAHHTADIGSSSWPIIPTPAAYPRGGGQHPEIRRAGGHQVNLEDWIVGILLPTPVAMNPNDGESVETSVQQEQPSIEHSRDDTWGEYTSAIHRWETVLDRTAPPPTLPDGKNGNHRLSPAFVEWMMGLPKGHVTDPAINITRNEQLKALGNGVVPQQAMYALRLLLEIP